MRKKILLSLLAIIIIIQFIRPTKNTSATTSPNDLAHKYTVPENVSNILKVSCNDCHSNNTVYPWYTNIQPVGWWMQKHVNDGKKHMDFSEFNSYKPSKQHHKMEEVIEMVEDDHMPLNSYLWIHKDAKLSPDQKAAVLTWATQLKDQIAKENNIVEKPDQTRK